MFDTLPSGWIVQPMKYLFSVHNGATPRSTEPSYWDGNIYWATPNDIGSLQGKILTDTKRKITEAGYENTGLKLAPVGSIILTTRASIGNVALTGVPTCTNQGCKTLIPLSGDVYPPYFYYQLLARKNELDSLATGTTFRELGTNTLHSIEVCKPSLFKQRQIADYLDSETATIDALLAANEHLLDLLAEKRQALITQTVTRGLNPNGPMQESGVEWLGIIPKHWKREVAHWVFKEIDERSPTGNEELLTVSHRTGVTRRSEKNVSMFIAESIEGYKICQSGDLVINTLWAWMGAMGVAFQLGIVSPDYHVYRSQGIYNPHYLDYLVRIPAFATEVTRNSKGIWSSRQHPIRTRLSGLRSLLPSKGVWASRLRLYQQEFFQIVFPIPPLEEQQEIAYYLRQEATKLDNLVSETERAIKLLNERRIVLIIAAVTGKIDMME